MDKNKRLVKEISNLTMELKSARKTIENLNSRIIDESKDHAKAAETIIELEKKDHYSDIISKISKYTNSDQKINKLVSPMPGLILEIQTKAGEKVKKDEPLIILEAMKMENVLCSPVDGIIREILVNTKQTVEKNSVLIKFDT